jgi:uncharacterized membrane protein
LGFTHVERAKTTHSSFEEHSMHWSPVLTLHITAGLIGLLSGTAALIFLKGSPRHALAGKVFVGSMLTMAASAVYLAALKHQNDNIGGGILTFYLITTAWLTARRKDGETSRFDWAILLVPFALGLLTWLRSFQMIQAGAPEGGFRIGMGFFMGSMMLLAGVGDLRMLLRGGVFGLQRIVRHLWRMCLGLFIASGSFFLGQGNKIFPSIFRDSPWLLIPAFLPLALLVFWIFRVRLSSTYKRMFLPPTPNASSARIA